MSCCEKGTSQVAATRVVEVSSEAADDRTV